MKRLVLDVEEQFHTKVRNYCRLSGRTVRGMLLLAVDQFMAQNPVLPKNDYSEYEKR